MQETKRHGFNLWVRKIPWSRKSQITPVFLPGKFHRQRSLVGYSQWDHKEMDTLEATEHSLVLPFFGIGMKPGFSSTWTVNFQMFELVLEKAEEPEIKLPTSAGSWKKQESSRKTSISALLPMSKTLTVWITINCGKFWKRWEYQTTWSASWETYMQVRKQQLELDMEQQTDSK